MGARIICEYSDQEACLVEYSENFVQWHLPDGRFSTWVRQLPEIEASQSAGEGQRGKHAKKSQPAEQDSIQLRVPSEPGQPSPAAVTRGKEPGQASQTSVAKGKET